MRNLKKVLFQFALSLSLGVNILEAGNDNLIPMRTTLYPTFNHYLIETSQGKIALWDSNPNLKSDDPTVIFIHGHCTNKEFLTSN